MGNGAIDSTFVRAHPCAAGAPKTGKQVLQALGRSRGGFSIKIHVTVDGLSNPLRLAVTARQAADLYKAIPLVDGFAFERLIADRAYAA